MLMAYSHRWHNMKRDGTSPSPRASMLALIILVARVLSAPTTPSDVKEDTVFTVRYEIGDPLKPVISSAKLVPLQNEVTPSSEIQSESTTSTPKSVTLDRFAVPITDLGAVQCLGGMTVTQCKAAKESIADVIDYLQGVILWKSSPRIKVTLKSFCAEGFPNCNNILGSAAPGYLYPGYLYKPGEDTSEQREPYLFPAGLVRQLNPSIVDNSIYDIVATFNTDANFTYLSTSGTFRSLTSAYHYDFRLILLHEFLHGLGFISSFGGATFASVYLDVNKEELLTPEFVTVGAPEFKFSSWQPMYIYDAFLYGASTQEPTQTQIASIAKKVFGYQNMVEISEWVRRFGRSAQGLYAKQLYQLSRTAGALRFKHAGEDHTLYTSPNAFIGGSSISHWDQTRYTGTADFLMRPAAAELRNMTFQQAVAEFANGWIHGIVGPATCQVLDAIGWVLMSDARVQTAEDAASVDMGTFVFLNSTDSYFAALFESSAYSSYGAQMLYAVMTSLFIAVLSVLQ